MQAADVASGRQRSFTEHAAEFLGSPVPEPWPELASILHAHNRLSTDANGVPLLSERRVFFEVAGLSTGLEEFTDTCFDAIEQEIALCRREKLDELTRGRED